METMLCSGIPLAGKYEGPGFVTVLDLKKK